MKKGFGKVIYSPSDLIRYLGSPFASSLVSVAEYAEFTIVIVLRE
jgi:hypothetical protein